MYIHMVHTCMHEGSTFRAARRSRAQNIYFLPVASKRELSELLECYWICISHSATIFAVSPNVNRRCRANVAFRKWSSRRSSKALASGDSCGIVDCIRACRIPIKMNAQRHMNAPEVTQSDDLWLSASFPTNLKWILFPSHADRCT